MAGADWYGHEKNNAPTPVDGQVNVTSPNYDKYVKLADGYKYHTYSANLSKCTFVYVDGKTYTQKITPTEYFYKGSEEKIGFYTVGNQVGKVNAVQQTGLKISNLHNNYRAQFNDEKVTTSYYWYDGAGTYHRVYVRAKYDWNWDTTYTIRFLYGDKETEFWRVQKTWNQRDNAYEGPALYSLSVDFNSDSELYMIADASGTKAMAIDQNGAAKTVNKVSGNIGTTNEAFAAIWDISDGTGLRNAKYTNKYLNLNSAFTASSGNGVIVEGNSFIGTSFSATATPKFTLKCNSGSYLTYSNNAFGMGNSGSALSIYEVTKSNDFQMRGTFVYQNIYNLMCGAYDEKGNLLTNVTSLSEEPENPAEEIGGETGNNT